MKRNIMIILVVLLMFALAVPDFAARVEKETATAEFVDTLVADCSVYGEGWDFAVLDDVVYTRTTTYWYDNDDVMVKKKFHNFGTDTVYREGYPEDGVKSAWHYNAKFDRLTDGQFEEASAHGNQYNIHLPGVGNVIRLTGSEFYVNWPEDGGRGELVRFVGLYSEDYEALCRYFAD